ncbi:MAG TPA: hypothetical protein VNE82_00025 [Candidatus Binataceae bacterium]|nr:hypothetical protein [Candidatus Binataceae bacterium]
MNAEQIFVDALAREPTADELRDIRLMVWMLTRAGFAVEDPSNAPFIVPWAWIWARLPHPADSHAALTAAGQTIAAHSQQGIERLEAVARELPAKIDHRAIAAGIAQSMPPFVVHNRIDAGVFRAALRESLSLIWVSLAAACIALAGYAGWHYSALHERAAQAPLMAQQAAELHRLQQLLDRLTPAHRR